MSGFASINPTAASPLLGFGSPPESAEGVPADISIIDFHGLQDDTIPYNTSNPGCAGVGPHNTLISSDGYFYENKVLLLNKWAEAMHCDSINEKVYPTTFDGENGFNCLIRECAFGNAIVRCTANYGHDYPLWHISHRAAADIAWNFMKRHPKTHWERI